tara:strand:- start:2402 stop:3244 length:843 start_codon:yes stop_codon:yes gene_type:complete
MGKKAQRRQEERTFEFTEAQMGKMEEWRAEQRQILDAQKAEFKQFEFTNPFEGMENVYEDLTVSQEAARFQMEQGRQQRANVMAGLSGAAGASGIAGLAQAMAQQGVMQARQVGADIDQQERQNMAMRAQGAQQVDQMFRAGEAQKQAAEFGRESTLLASELGEMAGARAGEQAAIANQMGAYGMSAQMFGARVGAAGQIIGGLASGFSDRRLKKNIVLVGKSPNGLSIYNFEYIDTKFGEGIYQGVMSDEIPQEAVIKHSSGFDMVNYSMLDVEFKKVK